MSKIKALLLFMGKPFREIEIDSPVPVLRLPYTLRSPFIDIGEVYRHVQQYDTTSNWMSATTTDIFNSSSVESITVNIQNYYTKEKPTLFFEFLRIDPHYFSHPYAYELVNIGYPLPPQEYYQYERDFSFVPENASPEVHLNNIRSRLKRGSKRMAKIIRNYLRQ